MAVFGEIILFLIGLGISFISFAAVIVSGSIGTRKGEVWFLSITTLIGGLIMWAAVHYGPISISFSAG